MTLLKGMGGSTGRKLNNWPSFREEQKSAFEFSESGSLASWVNQQDVFQPIHHPAATAFDLPGRELKEVETPMDVGWFLEKRR